MKRPANAERASGPIVVAGNDRPGYRRARPTLRNRRLSLGLSQREVAATADLPDQTLSRVERGEFGVSPERQAALASCLDVLVDDLFELERPRPADARRTSREAERNRRQAEADAITATVRRLYAEGKRDHEIADAIGKSRRSVVEYRKQLGLAAQPPARKHAKPEARECALEGCTEVFTPTGPQVANGYGDFCSRRCARTESARHPLPGDRACAWCGVKIRITPSDAAPEGHGRFCSYSHRQRFSFLNEPERVAGLIESLRTAGKWTGAAERRWAGRRKLVQVRDPSKKGAAAAREVGEAAVALVRRVGQTPGQRRGIVEALMEHFEGRRALYDAAGERRPREDREYRKAREAIMRRLRRAARDSGNPNELIFLVRKRTARM